MNILIIPAQETWGSVNPDILTLHAKLKMYTFNLPLEVRLSQGEGKETDFMTWLTISVCDISIAIDLACGLGHVPSILCSNFSSITMI